MNVRLPPFLLRHSRPIHRHLNPSTHLRLLAQLCPQRNYAQMVYVPRPSRRKRWTSLKSKEMLPTYLLLVATVALGVGIYSSGNEFLDSGFPPRAAEAFRIASVMEKDYYLKRSIRYWRIGLEVAFEHGYSPFDERILDVKRRLLHTLELEGDVAGQREVLEEMRSQAVNEIGLGNKHSAKLTRIAVQCSLSLANVRTQEDGLMPVVWRECRREHKTAGRVY